MALTPPCALPQALASLLPAELQTECTQLQGKRGDRLFTLHRKPAWMIFVASGEVVLQRLGIQGETVVVQRVRQGFVAEASLHSGSYHCEAVVMRAGDFFAIPIERLTQALVADPAFAMRWLVMVNQELRRLRAQCERLCLKTVKERLLHLIETEGTQGEARSLSLNGGLKSVASELGVSHEALYRSVAELVRQGVLLRSHGLLQISKPVQV